MVPSIEQSIIAQIRDLIIDKKLGAGDKFPAELTLSKMFEVSRRNIRVVISKLETYELVKTFPQSGTVIGNIGHYALIGILDNILELKEDNLKSLLETRIFLEISTAKLAAERRSEEELKQIEEKLSQYKKKTLGGEDATQEDILFHLAIAKACGNSTLNSLMLQIAPKLVSVFEYNRIVGKTLELPTHSNQKNTTNYDTDIILEIEKHEAIYTAIKDKNPELAVQCMKNHFSDMIEDVE